MGGGERSRGERAERARLEAEERAREAVVVAAVGEASACRRTA